MTQPEGLNHTTGKASQPRAVKTTLLVQYSRDVLIAACAIWQHSSTVSNDVQRDSGIAATGAWRRSPPAEHDTRPGRAQQLY